MPVIAGRPDAYSEITHYGREAALSLHTETLPDCVYRYLSRPEYVRQWLNGRLRLSTLINCATEEKGGTLDATEATQILVFPDGRRETFQNSDAFVLCTALNQSDYLKNRFGPYCIQIRQPRDFFAAVGEVVSRRYGTRDEEGNRWIRQELKAVEYKAREVPFGQPSEFRYKCFRKDPIPEFIQEDEFRFLWQPMPGRYVLKPEKFFVPAIKQYCSPAVL